MAMPLFVDTAAVDYGAFYLPAGVRRVIKKRVDLERVLLNARPQNRLGGATQEPVSHRFFETFQIRQGA
jgi:hypothetical protein